jgi:hypothetical protein
MGTAIIIILIIILICFPRFARGLGRFIFASIMGLIIWIWLGGVWGFLAFIAILIPTGKLKRKKAEEIECEETESATVIHNHYYGDGHNRNENIIDADYYEVTDSVR